MSGQSVQTGALHETFGDLTCLFVFLSQRELVEYLLKITNGNLHYPNCLSNIADELGLYGENCLLFFFFVLKYI